MQRPWQGSLEPRPAVQLSHYDPTCYLCPGNKRAAGVRNSDYRSTFVFENDFAALKKEIPDSHNDSDGKGLLLAEGEAGVCRVMCFHPRHDLTLSTMNTSDIEEVVRTWTSQFNELGGISGMEYVQIFENRGEMMGASNPHPHCQIWATSSIPQVPSRELESQRVYLQQRDSCMLCDYVSIEQGERERVVVANDSFFAVVPFWAVWPYEVLLCSKRHFGILPEMSAEEARRLSSILKQIVSIYDRVFDVPFPYSMGFHQSPTDKEKHPEWHFHAHFYPPLLRSATVRKFMVGFEMLGTPQRDITPEFAAQRLRLLARKHAQRKVKR